MGLSYRLETVICAAFLAIAAVAPRVGNCQPANPVSSFETLRAGDIVRLSVWREPDVSGEYVIDSRGRLSLPYVGEFVAAGMQREELRERVRRVLTSSIQDLSMQLLILRRVAILGAVRAPGLYPVDASLTVGDAVALAGGLTFGEAQLRVKWLRAGRVLENEVSPARLLSSVDLQPGDQLLVPERSWLSRNLATLISSSAAIAVALIYRTR